MRLDGVGFRYHRRSPWVLQGVSLALPPGRLVEITGPNGAGKSTLLRLLAGLLRPGRGTASGRPARIGYAPERFPASQPFTARAYLTHMARMHRLGSPPIEALADRLGFGALLDVQLAELSKGSAHKVGLIQALLPDPGLLLLDEPFAGLDAETRLDLPELLQEQTARGATVVVSDHQRGLRTLPGVDHLRVHDHTVTPLAAEPPAQTTIEVVVPTEDAAAVLAKLRAEGYRATERRRVR